MEKSKEKTNTDNDYEDFEPHLLATLAYLFPPITGIVFYLKEEKDEFVIFHSMQSMLFGFAAYILWRLFSIRLFFGLRDIIQPIMSLGIVGYWLYLIYSTYNKKKIKIPFIGDIAEKVINKKP